MKLHRHTPGQQNLIRAYSETSITVNEDTYTSSLVLQAEYLDPDWAPRTVADLDHGAMRALAKLDTEIILLGTGIQQQFPDPRLLLPCHDRGIGIEVMDTPAACRTYNILLDEGRHVTAALLLGE